MFNVNNFPIESLSGERAHELASHVGSFAFVPDAFQDESRIRPIEEHISNFFPAMSVRILIDCYDVQIVDAEISFGKAACNRF